MSQQNTTNVTYSSLGGLFFWGFIVVKAVGHIFAAWSWWWVLSPLWITASLATLVIAAMILKGTFQDKTNFR